MRRHPIMIIAIALVLALVSCTNDSGMNPGGSALTLRAAIGTDSASASETFSEGDVTILINGNKYTYTVSSDGKLSSEKLYYFQSTDSVEVQGIYPAIDSIKNNSFTWKVETNQSSGGYEKSDLLVSSVAQVSSEKRNASLAFYHQAARIVINVEKSDFLTSNPLSSVKINDVAITGEYTMPTGDKTHGKWTAQSGSTEGDITLRKTDFPAEGYAESYEAIVIPQEIVSGKELFVFTVEGYSPFSYVTDKLITWEAGKEYTYNVKKNAKVLDVSVNESIAWSDGENADGTVTLPETDVFWGANTAFDMLERSQQYGEWNSLDIFTYPEEGRQEVSI